MAEGVEHFEDTESLRAMGCYAAQGYYFAKAVPPEAFVGLFGHTLPLAKPD